MLSIGSLLYCSGCKACEQICPKNAISMVSNDKGFWYPKVDETKCINCGLCEKVCHYQNLTTNECGKNAFACYNKDSYIVKKSSSGGIFYLFCEYVISHGGFVFGAAFNDKFEVKHKSANTISECMDFLGSKYVQSDIGSCYSEAKEKLDNGTLVLFSGTPCQINGLKTFLMKEYKNLITVDVMCHGVPSPMVWDKYLTEVGRDNNIQLINFRDKTDGWNNFNFLVEYSNKRKIINHHDNNIFMKAFLTNLCLRESCYNCKSNAQHRMTDITIADFWGVKNVVPKFFNDKGISLAIINTSLGSEIFNKIQDKIYVEEVNIVEAVKYNPVWSKSVSKPKKYNNFFSMLGEQNIQVAVKKCVPKRSLKSRIKSILYRIAKKVGLK